MRFLGYVLPATLFSAISLAASGPCTRDNALDAPDWYNAAAKRFQERLAYWQQQKASSSGSSSSSSSGGGNSRMLLVRRQANDDFQCKDGEECYFYGSADLVCTNLTTRRSRDKLDITLDLSSSPSFGTYYLNSSIAAGNIFSGQRPDSLFAFIANSPIATKAGKSNGVQPPATAKPSGGGMGEGGGGGGGNRTTMTLPPATRATPTTSIPVVDSGSMSNAAGEAARARAERVAGWAVGMAVGVGAVVAVVG